MAPVNGSPTVIASLRFGTVASYYVREYYHGGVVQLAAQWYAPGNYFGLTDEDVDPARFQRPHAGLGDNGQGSGPEAVVWMAVEAMEEWPSQI